jgi:hypothetical protein
MNRELYRSRKLVKGLPIAQAIADGIDRKDLPPIFFLSLHSVDRILSEMRDLFKANNTYHLITILHRENLIR